MDTDRPQIDDHNQAGGDAIPYLEFLELVADLVRHNIPYKLHIDGAKVRLSFVGRIEDARSIYGSVSG